MGRGGRDDKADESQRLLGTPVYVNVYDMTRYNDFLYWLGLGVFHSGLEVHGVEYAFGAHNQPCSGVFELAPRCAPGFLFRTAIPVGTTSLSPPQVRSIVEQLACSYTGISYQIISRNCNHFTADLCRLLVDQEPPAWINRLARTARLCNCLMPDGVRVEGWWKEKEEWPGGDGGGYFDTESDFSDDDDDDDDDDCNDRPTLSPASSQSASAEGSPQLAMPRSSATHSTAPHATVHAAVQESSLVIQDHS
ncbi:hypothetical protein CLOP_g21717 [Closterium sp. NIES-67]|nr:hypothetical protein CLOP_g21717 [Closterium sp. NIES-67]